MPNNQIYIYIYALYAINKGCGVYSNKTNNDMRNHVWSMQMDNKILHYSDGEDHKIL